MVDGFDDIGDTTQMDCFEVLHVCPISAVSQLVNLQNIRVVNN